jgi:hypothetical protein
MIASILFSQHYFYKNFIDFFYLLILFNFSVSYLSCFFAILLYILCVIFFLLLLFHFIYCRNLKNELQSFDSSFFEEMEDLKVRYSKLQVRVMVKVGDGYLYCYCCFTFKDSRLRYD